MPTTNNDTDKNSANSHSPATTTSSEAAATSTEAAEVYARKRSEHLAWCKNRAYRYWREGDLANAVMSMGSDLDKHEATKCNPYLLLLGGMYATRGEAEEVRRWIEGFR